MKKTPKYGNIYKSQVTIFWYFKKKWFFFFSFFLEIYTIYCISVIGISIGRYGKIYIGNLLVSADKKIGFIGSYRYRPIWKKAYRSYTAFGASAMALVRWASLLLLQMISNWNWQTLHFLKLHVPKGLDFSTCHINWIVNICTCPSVNFLVPWLLQQTLVPSFFFLSLFRHFSNHM